MKSARLPLLLIALTIIAASYIRLANLGQAHLSHDELIHLYAAQSLSASGEPLLPSGVLYGRGIDVTRLVGLMSGLGIDPELAARLPSAFFGVLNLVLLGTVGWALIGPWGALWAVLLLTIYPEAVAQSRYVRFYTYQLNFALLAMFAGWQVLRRVDAREGSSSGMFWRRWLWALGAAACFLLAARIQITAFSVVAGWGIAVAVIGVIDLVQWKRRAWRESVPLQLAVLGLAGFLVVLAVRPDTVATAVAESQFVPVWAGGAPGSPLAYMYMLQAGFPILTALAPVAFLVVALRNPRLALYLAAWFGVPFLLHSFFFGWKGERYIFSAMPALFLAAGMASAEACGLIQRSVRSRLSSSGIQPRVQRLLAMAAVAVVVLPVAVTTPAFVRALKTPSGATEPVFRRENWSAVARILAESPESEGLPVGSSTPLASLFYSGGVDFAVRRDALHAAASWSPEAEEFVWVATDPEVLDRYQGAPDFYTAVPVLTTPEAIIRRFKDSSGVYIAIDSTRWVYGDIESALRRTLVEDAEELCGSHCGSILLFRWIFSTADGEQVSLR